MKYAIIVTIASVATVLTGCRTPPANPPPKEYTSVPLYMAGQEIPGDSQEKYLTNAAVKIYSVGRLVDPGTGTMREAGTVYRIEQSPQWNLIPQYDANPESFARRQLQEQYADSLVGQMNRSLAETQSVKHSLDAVQRDMTLSEQKLQALATENAQLKTELQKQHENTANLLSGVKKMQKYIELLEQKINDRNTMNFGGKK